MRIRRKIQLAGLAVALAGGASGVAEAGDRTISTAITTPVTTSNPDGTSVAGDVTVATGGSITVTAGQTAITVDSSNDVANAGTLASNDANNTTGVLIQGGNSGNVVNSGSINLLETYTIADSNADGDLDGNVATGTNRHGIFLQAGPTFTGGISNTGTIGIEGNNSSGITTNALLTGTLTNSGVVNVIGDNSTAIAINGGVTGDVTIAGAGLVRGQNSTGIHINSNVGGELSLSGTWTVTGYLSSTAPSDQSNLDADDLEQSGAAILVNGNVADGITVVGVGNENDLDDDDDATEGEADDNAGAQVSSLGSAPAMLIQANGANLTVGAGASGFGLLMRGQLTSSGVFDGINATTLRIAGNGGFTTTIDGGISIDNALFARAAEGNAIGLLLDQGSVIGVGDLLQIRGGIFTTVTADGANIARGVYVNTGAALPELNNSGVIQASMFGEVGDAIAFADASGTVSSITNSGQIVALLIPTDDNLTDGIPPPNPAGDAIAIDVSNNAGGVTIQQIAPVVFTDDDTVDDVVAAPANITGDILFGSGADVFNLLSGAVSGDVSFGAGADTFTINNGAVYSGSISDAGGDLILNLTNGTLNQGTGALNITSATFGASSQYNPFLSSVPANSATITASGTVTFAAGASINPILPEGLPVSGTQTFLTANGGMFGAANVVGAVATANSPYLYTVSIGTTNPIVEGAANALQATFQLRTPAQLGLSDNQAIAFDPILAALRLDDDASAAMAAITSQYEFFDAYEDLLPNYADGATEIAATAIQQMQSATSNRMSATRMQGLEEVSVWGQEIAYGLTREAPTANSQEFRGNGFGFAAGIDGPTNNGDLFGLSASFIASEVEEPGRPEGEISLWFVQGSAYYATALGPVDLDFIGGLGGGKMQSRRFVEIGNPVAFSALSEAEWMAYEGHGAIRASVPLALTDTITITPQAALTYVGISEEGYEETGGGAAIDYRVDSVFSQRLWADVGVELAANFRFGQQTVVAPRIYAGYRANTLDAESERTVEFISTGTPFTLTDEGVGDGGPLIGVGFDATNGYSTFSLGYEGEFSDQIERHSINAAIRFRF
ncbi:MAG: autotransporter domain-containing protein [Hyphomonadaceae bacterium]|nr:autotransporter domain-containing protein [Hyphomonadaceae bacterium]